MRTDVPRKVVQLTNELVVLISDSDWAPQLLTSLKESYTPQIRVDDVLHFATPFGAHMLCIRMTVTRARAVTYDLRDYLCRVLNRNGLPVDLSEIHAPSRARLFRVS